MGSERIGGQIYGKNVVIGGQIYGKNVVIGGQIYGKTHRLRRH
jgi:hypothetical protein